MQASRWVFRPESTTGCTMVSVRAALSERARKRLFREVAERRSMAIQTGERVRCSECGSEFIATRGGEAELICCGKPVEPKS